MQQNKNEMRAPSTEKDSDATKEQMRWMQDPFDFGFGWLNPDWAGFLWKKRFDEFFQSMFENYFLFEYFISIIFWLEFRIVRIRAAQISRNVRKGMPPFCLLFILLKMNLRFLPPHLH